MGKYPVTQAQWLKVMGKNPSRFNEKKVGKEWEQHPVGQVSWDDVQEFLKKLNELPTPAPSQEGNSIPSQEGERGSTIGAKIPLLGGGRGGLQFRLPSEAEWEYACRARAETIFYFGDDVNALKKIRLAQ